MLITDLETGVVPLHLTQLAGRLDKGEFDVHVACLAGEGPIARDLRNRNIPVKCLGAKGPWDIRVFYRLAVLLGRYRPHILHGLMVHPNVAGRLVGSIMSVPHIIASIHTAEKEKRWHLEIEKFTCRLSRLTVCVSASVYRHVRRHSRVPASRMCTIAYGIDIPRFADAEPVDLRRVNLDPQKPTLIFVGRLHPVKGVDLLLDAFWEIARVHDAQLIIVGDGPLRDTLECRTRKLELTEKVVFCGMCREVAGYLKAAAAMVMPSYWEGLPIAAIEAMAAGLPVIASRTEGLIDLIEDGKTGLLFTTGHRNEMKNAISRILSNPPWARTLGQNARHLITRQYSQQTMIDAYTRLYRSLVS